MEGLMSEVENPPSSHCHSMAEVIQLNSITFIQHHLQYNWFTSIPVLPVSQVSMLDFLIPLHHLDSFYKLLSQMLFIIVYCALVK